MNISFERNNIPKKKQAVVFERIIRLIQRAK
jgi:hypothetical protein